VDEFRAKLQMQSRYWRIDPANLPDVRYFVVSAPSEVCKKKKKRPESPHLQQAQPSC
jgi:hypothetical protein